MSAKDTEQKLIRVIAEHYLERGEGKLTIQVASERAGISRQSFHRKYDHLKSYVLGKRPIEELIKGGMDDVRGLLGKCQIRVRELQEELGHLRAEHDAAIERERESYITTLMNSDITLRNNDQVRDTLEKQALHNEVLVKEIQRLELELTAARSRDLSLSAKVQMAGRPDAEVIGIEPDLTAAFEIYSRTKDQDSFEDHKDKALEQTLKRLNKLCQHDGAAVILFVDRYLSSFRKYVDNYREGRLGKTIIVRMPLFNRIELKLLSGKLPEGTPVAIHVPFCASEAVIKAQRKFLFRDVPDIELDAADKMALPLIQDGYVEVTVFNVKQGD